MSATAGQDQSLIGRPTIAARSSVTMWALPSLIVLGCAFLAIAAPIGVSIVAVFLFAGPHNWMEARYFLSRMPARWGRLAGYFSLGLVGTLILGGFFAVMPWLASDNADIGLLLVAVWNSLLTVWIVSLTLLRSQQNPRRDCTILIPIGFGFIAINWIWPLAWSLGLVYLHPLLALWFLNRELRRRRSKWQKPVRGALSIVPACLIGMSLLYAGSADLPEGDLVAWQIAHHAGASVFPRVSTHFLVAAHIFLELLHYLVWVAVMPIVSQQSPFWQAPDAPLARCSTMWRRVIAAIVVAGAVLMLLLWGAFLTDYTATRNIYFTVAILHVLMEVPFLIRSL